MSLASKIVRCFVRHRARDLSRAMWSAAALSIAMMIGQVATCRAAVKTLRIGYILSKSSQLGAGADVFASEIARRTSGRFKVEAYPDAMLGGDLAMIHDVQMGALDLAFITGAPLPAVVPAVGVFNIPFLFRDADQARRTLDGPIGDEYLAKFENSGVVALAWGENGLRHMTCVKRDLSTPDGLKGLKLRLPQSDTMAAGFEALGAKVQQIPFNQLYIALKNGRVEAQENPIATIVASHFSQVQTQLVLTGHIYDPAALLISHDVYDALSDADRANFREAARLAGIASRVFAAEQERTGVDALRAQGMEIVHVDRAAFAQRAAAAAPRWNAMYGAEEIARIRSYDPPASSPAVVQ